MNSHPLLSIVTVCFNDLPGLKETEKSIKDSPSSPLLYEWIVIDGNSSDGTKDFLSESTAVNSFISEKDSGIYDAMNKGTKLSKSPYVIYMNSGDTFTDLNLIIDTIKSNNFDLFFFDARFIYGQHSRIRKAKDFSYIKHGIPANHQAIVFKRHLLGDAPYDTSYKICGDYKLLADLYVGQASHLVINQTTAEFHVGGVSTHRGLQLLNEAYEIQRNTLHVAQPRAVLSYLKRTISITLTLIIHRLSNVTKQNSKP